jgi:hypothetical protein
MPNREDAFADTYFRPLERAERANDCLFYASAALSIMALLVDKSIGPVHDLVQIAFIASVVFYFAIGLAVRLYFSPRANDVRYRDFVAHAFAQPMMQGYSEGYYNSQAPNVAVRFAAQTLENSLYSKDTVTQMLHFERLKLAAYVIVFVVALAYRRTDIDLLGVAAQILFSEQIFSRWLRMEWLRQQFEATFERLCELFRGRADLEVAGHELTGRYERAKAIAGISLSPRIFFKRQALNDAEWANIRTRLGL